MGILARYSHKKDENLQTPGRVYLHRAGHGAFIGNGMTSLIKGAALYAQNVLTSRLYSLEKCAYFIGVLWGDGNNRALDLFEYTGIDPSSTGEAWQKSNPDVKLWIIRENEWVSEGRTCEDTTVILGREGEHRRRTQGLAEFIETFPDLGGIEPVDERYKNLRLWVPIQVDSSSKR